MENIAELIQRFYKDNIFLYVMGGLCALGVLLKFFLLLAYNRLIRASESMAMAKNPWMKNMKLRFETAYQLKIGVNDVDTYVDKYVSKTKFGGLLLSTWENLSGQTIALCLLTGSCAGVLGLVYECEQGAILFTFFTGAWTAIVVNIVDNIVNISAHKQMLRYNLIDYFENYLKVRMEQEIFHPEMLKSHQREYFNNNERETENFSSDRAALESACFSHWESKRIQRLERRRKRKLEAQRREDESRLEFIERQSLKEKEKKDKIEARLLKQREKKERTLVKQQLKEAKALAVTIEQQVNKDKQESEKGINKNKKIQSQQKNGIQKNQKKNYSSNNKSNVQQGKKVNSVENKKVEVKQQVKAVQNKKEEKLLAKQKKFDDRFRMEQEKKLEQERLREAKLQAIQKVKEDKEKEKKAREEQKQAKILLKQNEKLQKQQAKEELRKAEQQ